MQERTLARSHDGLDMGSRGCIEVMTMVNDFEQRLETELRGRLNRHPAGGSPWLITKLGYEYQDGDMVRPVSNVIDNLMKQKEMIA